MKKSKLSLVLAGALGLLVNSGANAESTYGYNSAGTGTVTATARVNLSVVVPKVVVLRVATAGAYAATTDVMAWNVRVSIPATPTTVDGNATATFGNSQAVSWDGAAPTVSFAGTAPTANAYAWTNGSNVTVTCSATAFAAGGPALANITAAAAGGDTFAHPTGTLNACVATPALTAGTLYTGTWTYTLDTTSVANWAPGAYTSVVTYTASGT